MIDIVLLFPYYVGDTFFHLLFDWHLGAAYIQAYLKERSIFSFQFTYKTPITLGEIADKVLEHNPKVVGFTCYDVNYYFVKLISRELKKRDKNITIILGGPSATFSDELILKDEPSIDICVRGEGEQTTFELITCLKKGDNLHSISGISYRNAGRVIKTKDRPLLRGQETGGELDVYPSPYVSGIFPPRVNAGILTSRGCVHHCIYCNFSAMSRWIVRYHSLTRVIEELRHIARSNPDSIISFHDDNFLCNKQRAKKICRHIVEEKLPLRISCLARPENIDRELLELMKRANIEDIAIGLESSVPRDLRTIKKVTPSSQSVDDLHREEEYIEKIKAVSDEMHHLGLTLELSIITGLPDQTQDEARQVVDFVDRLHPLRCYHDFLTIYPGTFLFQARKKFHLDITAPKTVLPFKTEFPFDVSKIRLSRYALPNYQFMDSLIGITANILAREITFFSGEASNIFEIFLKGSPRHLSESIGDSQIKKRLTLSPVFLLMTEPSKDKDAGEELCRLIERGTPLINLLVLRKLENVGTNIYELIFITEVIERRRLPSQKIALFAFIPLSELNSTILREFKRLKNERYDRKVVMLLLHSKEDKAAFASLINDISSAKEAIESQDLDFHMVNACQWSSQPCPAIRQGNIYIDGRSSFSLCNKKGAFEIKTKDYALGDLFCMTQKRVLLSDIEKRRGCRHCKVQMHCSKCVNTYPYAEGEFCNLRREENPEVFMKLLRSHNLFESFGRQSQRKAGIDLKS